MPRRAASSDANGDSFKENGDLQVKAEKVKAEGARRAAKPRPVQELPEEEPPARDEDANGEEQEPEEQDDEDDDEGGGSPRGAKRARANENGDDVHKEETKKYGTQPRDVDGFIPGSITRIQLCNFVTYDYVEFTPGPYLNMILGPNGTGKSSIACAICLGLNFSPALLGRATELSAFVKIGQKEGYIEIELKGSKGRKNLVIRRGISSTTKSSSFTLNGHSSSGKEITNKVAELGVQVGNLCSFLPQDRVSEFAQMSSQELLKQTQRAAGDQRLSSWHTTLIAAGKEKFTLDKTLMADIAQLATLKERNALLERDVQQVKARQALEAEIAVYEVLIPIKRYYQSREDFQEKKAEQRVAHSKANALKERNQPAHALNEKLAQDVIASSKLRDSRKDAVKVKMKKMLTKRTESDRVTHDIQDLDDKLTAIKRAEKTRTQKIKETKKKIERMQHELDNPPDVEDPAPLAAEMLRLNRELTALSAEKHDVVSPRMQDNYNEAAKEKANLDQARRQLHALTNEDGRKLEALRKWDPQTTAAVEWLRNNKGLFEMEVFETPFLCCTVPDKRFLNAVESCFSANSLKMLVAQTQKDYDTLNYHLNDTGVLKDRFPGQQVRINTWYRPPSEAGPPPMSPADMQGLHFDGYALDFIQYPEGLKYYLTKELQMHRTAVAINARAVDVGRAMATVARSGGANFIVGMTLNKVSRSKYGTRAAQNSTREINQARNLGATTVDHEAKSQAEQRIRHAEQNIEQLAELEQQLREQNRKLQAASDQAVRDKESVKRRQRVVMDAESRMAKNRAQLENFEKSLEEQENAPSADAETANLKKKIFDQNKKRVRIVKEYAGLVASVLADQVGATNAGLQHIQISANEAALRKLCAVKDKEYQDAMAAHDVIWAEVKDAKAAMIHSRDASQNAIENMNDEVRAQVGLFTTPHHAWEKEKEAAKRSGLPAPAPGEDVDMRNLDELQDELDAKQGDLEQAKAANPGVIAMYERRLTEIAVLEETIEERQKKADRIQNEIDNAEKHWKPALYKLVKSIGKKFSASFDRIGCAGEIQINENEDYDKWAIDILVKFRDKEKLQILTAQRQSGGERSLTTILYLMSLAEEARAPFSLVDEINQGMDARAERAVHDSMVSTTCKEDAAQYFLITPKLLPDLTYDRRMKVLCVNNGEWIPEERGLGNMNAMLDVYVSRKKA